MIKRLFIGVYLFIQYLYYSIVNKLVIFNNCLIYNNNTNQDKTILINFINILHYFKIHKLIESLSNQINKLNNQFNQCNKIIRVDKDKYYIYNNKSLNEIINLKTEDIKHKISVLMINGKNINIVKYNGDCKLKDIVNFEVGYCDDEFNIEYMNEDFDEFNKKLKDIGDKSLVDMLS